MAPTTTPKKQTHKLKRVFKSAARFPVPLPRSLTSARKSLTNLTPLPGELPLTHLRLQVLSCTGLLAKDRNGASDPYVVVSVLNNKHQTPVAKRTLNPTYTKDATFDFPIYLSLADRLGVLELVVWDKDYLGKDYLGEAALPLDDWFTCFAPDEKDRSFAFDDAGNTVSLSLFDRCVRSTIHTRYSPSHYCPLVPTPHPQARYRSSSDSSFPHKPATVSISMRSLLNSLDDPARPWSLPPQYVTF
jgi:C2 domain